MLRWGLPDGTRRDRAMFFGQRPSLVQLTMPVILSNKLRMAGIFSQVKQRLLDKVPWIAGY